MSTQETRDYYERTQLLYNLLWSRTALHYGLWGRATRTLNQAIENTNETMGRLLDVQKTDSILDLGCGVGGTAITLAKRYGCHVVGVTLSKKQIRQGEKRVHKLNLGHLVQLQCIDFERRLPFPDSSFEKIIAIESLCYAEDKTFVLQEAFRVLKPGGRLIILDGFLQRTALASEEQRQYAICLRGWRVPFLLSVEQCLSQLQQIGFIGGREYNRTKDILPSCRRITALGYLLFPFTWLLSRLSIIPKALHENTECMVTQGRILNHFASYDFIIATKPQFAS